MSRFFVALTLVVAVCGCRSNECGQQAPRCGAYGTTAPIVPSFTTPSNGGFRGAEATPVSDRSMPAREARLLGK